MKKIALLTTAVLFACAIGVAIYLYALQLTGNFHEVVAGQLYRSAQVSPTDIQNDVRRYGIKTIINLRGENKGAAWYDEEIAAAAQQNIVHFDFRMSAKHSLDQAQVNTILGTMKTAPKPILIHCRSGADRSGLISAMYVAHIAKLGEKAAEDQISFFYGHMSFGKTQAMDAMWEKLEPLFGFSNS